ncbi:hypothetical protein CYMTET_41038 [Cymbomonas tetramitiformis]|uniref:Uncharacterized protein n=1 Tax=Cymbomonas tetramitiformis TaxID=36881 RepID=A0AAE0F316_9CHLO|nr:hypothetical protein CYMTET_41038 [Cymbomonas tetramitiformis]
MDTELEAEIARFTSLRRTAAKDPQYRDALGNFNLLGFWYEHRVVLRVHCACFRADVGCLKATSANVECTFSAVGTLLADFHSHNLGSALLEAYMIIRGNWKYTFLRPTSKEIQVGYVKKYGAVSSVEEESGEDGDYESD